MKNERTLGKKQTHITEIRTGTLDARGSAFLTAQYIWFIKKWRINRCRHDVYYFWYCIC